MNQIFEETFELGENKLPVKFCAHWFAEEGEEPQYHIQILVKVQGECRQNSDLRGHRIRPELLKEVLERLDEPKWPSTVAPKIKLGLVHEADLVMINQKIYEHAINTYSRPVEQGELRRGR